MVSVNKHKMAVEGSNTVVAAETAMLLSELREREPELLPVILASVYSHAGTNALEKTLKNFKEDMDLVLEKFRKLEARK